jgi:hypothetical protein
MSSGGGAGGSRGHRGQPVAPNNGSSTEKERRMSDQLIIVVTEIEGRGRYEAHVGDRIIVKSSRTPFLDAARVLLAEGYDRTTRIFMRHAHDGIDCLTSTVGKAATLEVYEDERGGRPPVFRKWRHSHTPRQSPPIDLNEILASTPRPVEITGSVLQVARSA